MALTFTTKMKTNLLNSWGASKKIYVGLYDWVSGGYEKKGEGNFTLTATPAVNNKITYSTPINITIGNDSTVSFIGLFDSAPPSSFQDTNFPASILAFEAITAETFTYGGTFRINSIEIELT